MSHHKSAACIGPKVAKFVIKVLSTFGIAVITTVRNTDVQMKAHFLNDGDGSLSTAQRYSYILINLRQNFTPEILNSLLSRLFNLYNIRETAGERKICLLKSKYL